MQITCNNAEHGFPYGVDRGRVARKSSRVVAVEPRGIRGGRGWKHYLPLFAHARAQDFYEPSIEVVAERRVGDPVHYGIVDDGRLGEESRSSRGPRGDQFDVSEDGDEADDYVRRPGDQEQNDECKDDLGNPNIRAFSYFPFAFFPLLRSLSRLSSMKGPKVSLCVLVNFLLKDYLYE